MTSIVLLAWLMACAAVTIGTVAGWFIAALSAPQVAHSAWSATTRARVLAQLRTFPLTCALIVTLAQVSAFIRFETSRAESAGPLLFCLATAGALLATDALWRGAKSWRRTVALIAEWRARAMPFVIPGWRRPAWVIRPAAPVVAVVGAFRPHLFVARQVVDECTPAEMTAIAAHEAAHVAARDNLVRLLFAVTPGTRLVPGIAEAIERHWRAAAEEAADARASRETGRLQLASALTKVARLAVASPLDVVAASALIGASDLETRVRRLLDPTTFPPRAQRAPWLPPLLLLVTAVMTQVPAVSVRIHEVFELLVRSK